MADYYINVNVRTTDAGRVRALVTDIFTARDFALVGEAAASVVVEDEDALPDGDNWYGVVVSGVCGRGWVTVYVEDWADSGVLARELSGKLDAPALEIWVAEDVHWGYTFYENGEVRDRFTDDPSAVADTKQEAALYAGRAAALEPVLLTGADALQAALDAAHGAAGQFVGPGVDALAQAVGLPFEHAFTGYEFFFTDDAEDFGPSLEHWGEFRHLAYHAPAGRETLA